MFDGGADPLGGRRAGRRGAPVEARIAERVPPGLRRDLEHLLEETADAGVTRFVQFRRRQPAAGPPRAPPAPRCPGRPLPRNPLRIGSRGCAGRGSATSPTGSASSPDNRRLAILAVCAVEWELFLADAVVETHDRLAGRTYREAARACESAARGRDGRGPRGALGIRRAGEGAARCAGRRRGPRRGDRGRSGMGGPRRPRRQGGRAREHGRVGPDEPRPGRLQPFPPLHAAHAAHAGHQGVARGRAVAGRGRRPAQRRHGAADRLPAAELEVEPAAFRAGDVWLARSRRYDDIRKALLSGSRRR